MHLVPILMLCREDNEKCRNGRGKRRSENSRWDTEQLQICRQHITNGRKKADLTKLIKGLKRESEKASLYLHIKKTKNMTTAELGQPRDRQRGKRSSNQ